MTLAELKEEETFSHTTQHKTKPAHEGSVLICSLQHVQVYTLFMEQQMLQCV